MEQEEFVIRLNDVVKINDVLIKYIEDLPTIDEVKNDILNYWDSYYLKNTYLSLFNLLDRELRNIIKEIE